MKCSSFGVFAGLLLALVWLTPSVFAQGRGGMGGGGMMNATAEEIADRQVQRLQEAVTDLSAAQLTKVKEITLANAKEIKALQAEANGDMQGMREKMQPIRQKMMDQLKTVLNPAQFQAYLEAIPNRRGGMGGPPPNGQGQGKGQGKGNGGH